MNKLLIILALSYLCVGQADEDRYDFSPPPSYRRTHLGDTIDKATLKLLKATYDVAEDKNIVSSPLGLMILLSLYNVGSGPGTSSELSSLLGETDSLRGFESFKWLSGKYSRMKPDHLTVANKIVVAEGLSLNETFASAARDYHSEFDTLDFTKPEEAAAAINKWAAEKTKGLITEPISKDTLTPDVVAALFNVIYFKGHWHVPFKAEETKEEDYHVSRNQVVKKPMMHLFQSLYYGENSAIGAKMIELPYKEEGFRMVVVLPNEIDGLPSVLEKAAEKGLLSDVLSLNPAGRDIDLAIPKFEIRAKLDFNEILPKVGITKLFTEDAPGIVKNTPVTVSKAFQEAFIKVDEEGATAGAFTGLILVATSSISEPPPPMKFTVDHPFLYLILHEDKILFAGTHST